MSAPIQQKRCPQCGKLSGLHDQQCGGCGRFFRTQFPQHSGAAAGRAPGAAYATTLPTPAQPASAPPGPHLASLATQGAAAEQAGRLAEAHRHYFALFQADPTHRIGLLGLTRLAAPTGQLGDLPHRLAWHVYQAPWDFEAVDLLLECDPGALAKVTPSVFQARASLPPPPRRHLSWQDTAHSRDLQLMAHLHRLPGLQPAIAEQQARLADAAHRRTMLLNTVRVGPNQLPGLWRLVVEAAQRTGMAPPECYVESSSEMNAFAAGAIDCCICLTTRLLDSLNDAELLFVIGHEMGHILHRHVFYQMLGREVAQGYFQSAQQAAAAANVAGALSYQRNTVGALSSLAALVAAGVAHSREQEGVAALLTVLRWQQFSEFSADRAGVVACRSTEAAVSALVKVAELAPSLSSQSRFNTGFNLEAFLDQFDEAARHFAHVTPEADYLRSHPYMAARIRSLQAWPLSWAYHCLLPGEARQPAGAALGDFAL